MLSEKAKKSVDEIMNDVKNINKGLYDYLNIIKETDKITIKIDPIKIVNLLANYGVRFLNVITMKTTISTKKIFLKKEYDDWKAQKYLEVSNDLSLQKSGKRVLKDEIENTLITKYKDDIFNFESEINKLTLKEEFLENIITIFKNIKYSFNGLSDMKEIWKPFLSQETQDILLDKNNSAMDVNKIAQQKIEDTIIEQNINVNN